MLDEVMVVRVVGLPTATVICIQDVAIGFKSA